MTAQGTSEPRGRIPPALKTGVDSAATRASRLPLMQKVGYAAGQLVELVVGSMLNMFALFYATAVCGLSGGLAGVALGAGLIVDAVMDPFIGSLSDAWTSRFGRRVPFMVAAVMPLALSFNLIFSLPSGVGPVGAFLWLMTLSIALRISLSLFVLPYQALGAELSDDYAERSSIAAWRWGVGILGTIAVIALGYGVFLSGPGGVSHLAGYQSLTMTLTALIAAGAVSAIRIGLVTRTQQHEPAAPAERALHHRLFGEVAEMFRNRTFRILFGASLLLNVAQGISQALALHVILFFWKVGTEQMPTLSVAAILGFVLAAPLSSLLSGRVEKRTMLAMGLIGMALFQSIPVVLRLLGLLPVSGGLLTGILAASMCLGGLMFALSIIAFISIIPDAADEHEHLFGTRREGLYFAGWLFATKAATGAGLLVAGVVLQLIDFPLNVSAEQVAAAAIPARTGALLGLAGGPGTALLALVGTGLVLLYRLDRRAHERIVSDLVARRGVQGRSR